ncbi:MAG: acyl-CoA dehydrogenase family protein [Microbispora sp.]|nr:acyl-CoA dehydrogenase family protein [Microbispora sp.]
MAIDFTLAPEHGEIRARVRTFIRETVIPAVEPFEDAEERARNREEYLRTIVGLRRRAKEEGFWLPHLPKEWGGMGLGHVELAIVQAEAAKTRLGPWVLNCAAPDEGNMHTLLHWGTDEQKERYLRPLADGVKTSCFAMTEPEVAGSDPTLIRTHAVKDGDEWVINGHKWFISNARRANFAILIAKTEFDLPEGARGANTAFLVDLPADKGEDFRTEVSMAKHFVAGSLNRIIDRAVQIHGALGYSTDTPLAHMFQHARWARLADGADEIHRMRIAERTIDAYRATGSTRAATGGLPL